MANNLDAGIKQLVDVSALVKTLIDSGNLTENDPAFGQLQTFKKHLEDWLTANASELKGQQGNPGPRGAPGAPGDRGEPGPDGPMGETGGVNYFVPVLKFELDKTLKEPTITLVNGVDGSDGTANIIVKLPEYEITA